MSRRDYEPERTPMEVGLARERERERGRHPLECCECGATIQEGATFYRFSGSIYCERCTTRYHADVAPYADEL